MDQPTPQLPKVGTIIGDKYEVVGVLGQGGMGAVYEATHRLTGKRFAIKWLLPDISDSADAMQRFLREAQAAGRIDHPNVVQVYDLGQQDGSLYMVMELLQGQSLHDLLNERGSVAPQEAAEIMIPLLRGVAAAHDAGVIHRDLKPDNLFLCRDGGTGALVPKVLDFGISKLGEVGGEVSARITKTGMVMGTPHYMPGEQLRSKDVDNRTDVYALGVILYQMLSGKLPFPGDNYGDLVLQIVTETPAPLCELVPELPAEFGRVVEKAMARDPQDRFATVAALAHALEPFAQGAVFDTGERPLMEFATAPTEAMPSLPPPAPPTPMTGGSTVEAELPTGRPPRALLVGVIGATVGIAALGMLALSLSDEADEGSWADEVKQTPPAAAASAKSDDATPSGADDGAGATGEAPAGTDTIPIDLGADAPDDNDTLPRAVLPPADDAEATEAKAAQAQVEEAKTAPEPARKPARKKVRRAKAKKRAHKRAAAQTDEPDEAKPSLGGRTVDMSLDDF